MLGKAVAKKTQCQYSSDTGRE